MKKITPERIILTYQIFYNRIQTSISTSENDCGQKQKQGVLRLQFNIFDNKELTSSHSCMLCSNCFLPSAKIV